MLHCQTEGYAVPNDAGACAACVCTLHVGQPGLVPVHARSRGGVCTTAPRRARRNDGPTACANGSERKTTRQRVNAKRRMRKARSQRKQVGSAVQGRSRPLATMAAASTETAALDGRAGRVTHWDTRSEYSSYAHRISNIYCRVLEAILDP